MTWNYRLVKQEFVLDGYEKPEITIGIHEVYYDDNGKAWGCTLEPVAIQGTAMGAEDPVDAALEECKRDLALMRKAFALPIIDIKDIPEEGSEYPYKDGSWTKRE